MSRRDENQVRRPNVLIAEDRETLFTMAATFIASQASEAVARRGRFLLAISGGDTPLTLYEMLGSPPYRDQIPWSDIHVFWVDERLVPPSDEASNYAQAWKVWLAHVPLPPEQIHPVDTSRGAEEAASDYANRLLAVAGSGEACPRFDVILLGLGADGHTASLFPGSPYPRPELAIGIVAEYGDRPAARVTLTETVINRGRHIVFLVLGASKAPALTRVFTNAGDPLTLPALRIWPEDGQLSWFIDRPAASLLPRRDKRR